MKPAANTYFVTAKLRWNLCAKSYSAGIALRKSLRDRIYCVDYSWTRYAECREYPTELFFSDEQGSLAEQKRVQQIACGPCPVRRQCLAAALWEERGLSKNNRFGVRGGLMAYERAKLWKELRSRRQVPYCRKELHPLEAGARECVECRKAQRLEWKRKNMTPRA